LDHQITLKASVSWSIGNSLIWSDAAFMGRLAGGGKRFRAASD